jgi:hypothetical protein
LRGVAIVVTGAATLVAGCGGGDRQDKNESSGTFKVDIVKASFPKSQSLAQAERFVISVRNAETARSVPNVAVTVDSFSKASQQAGLADPERPVWIVDAGPRGGTTAYTNTWALGPLAPGQTKTFVWRVTPIKAGTQTVSYQVAAGLNGKAKARLPNGAIPQGKFIVAISGKPAQSTVDPNTGEVVRTAPSQPKPKR